jgi:leucyl aminopeptidase
VTIAGLVDPIPDATPIWPVARGGLSQWLAKQPPAIAAWIAQARFTGEPGSHLLLPGDGGKLAGVAVGIAEPLEIWSLADLPRALPAGNYRLASPLDAAAAGAAALGWSLGCYEFSRYRKPKSPPAQLVWPDSADRAMVERTAAATVLVRDLVNTPAGDMGPDELAHAALALAERYSAAYSVIVGEELLQQNYPLIHAVGRASAGAPRLVDIRWGRADAPKVTLVGKGVCFDSGGLDLKSSSNMALMKKDMGGAATVLGLAQMVMDAGLPVRLRVLVPAVENAVSGNAFRPGDVLPSRKGTTVEITNTDAEGRLVLADALAEAAAEAPELLFDCATLTGAARVALGPELPALFSTDDQLAADLLRLGLAVADPLWRLPLHAPYKAMLDSKIADLCNAPDSSFAGCITAALFLKEFVAPVTAWAHFDLYAWNAKARPGRPVGGEAMAMRALFALLAERYPA